ncbi:hydrolase CocE/NonD family protein [Thozetella sp. PMI_491]|nr:hydrolase CocE/NonD family protein [Thozetella sp. PMI_491]
MAPATRGWVDAFRDKLSGWLWDLPPECCSYTVENVRIPLKDSAEANAFLYRPLGSTPLGTILIRTPYGLGAPGSISSARIYAARGYQVLYSACRGTAGSSGVFRPFSGESEDGQSVVSWMREQPWYTGSFATMGGSYLGFTQLAILDNPPPDMKAAIVSTAPYALHRYVWGTGALNSDLVTWAAMMTRMRKIRSYWLMPLYYWLEQRRMRHVLTGVPLLGAIDSYLDGNTPPWISYALGHPNPADEFWESSRHWDALERANIPILLFTGWYDHLIEEVMEQYERLIERGCNVALTIGPWVHLEAQRGATKLESFNWLEEHLNPQPGPGVARKSAVRFFVTGAREWREVPRWPPPTRSHELYLCSGGSLAQDGAASDVPSSSFEFDPRDPTPTTGAAMLSHMDGKKDNDAALAKRFDVLTFTTGLLDRDVEVCGRPLVELYHSTSSPHADLYVRLCEVDSWGRSHNITEQYLRLSENRRQEALQIALLDCGHRFRAGHRIRLLVAGGCHPRYIRNMGTGEDPATGTALCIVTHTIQHNASAVSRLVLPATI